MRTIPRQAFQMPTRHLQMSNDHLRSPLVHSCKKGVLLVLLVQGQIISLAVYKDFKIPLLAESTNANIDLITKLYLFKKCLSWLQNHMLINVAKKNG